jgi:hypothetical protein
MSVLRSAYKNQDAQTIARVFEEEVAPPYFEQIWKVFSWATKYKPYNLIPVQGGVRRGLCLEMSLERDAKMWYHHFASNRPEKIYGKHEPKTLIPVGMLHGPKVGLLGENAVANMHWAAQHTCHSLYQFLLYTALYAPKKAFRAPCKELHLHYDVTKPFGGHVWFENDTLVVQAQMNFIAITETY